MTTPKITTVNMIKVSEKVNEGLQLTNGSEFDQSKLNVVRGLDELGTFEDIKDT